jgi:hypothetical protein
MHDLDRTKDIMESSLDALDDSELAFELDDDGDELEFEFELDGDDDELNELAAELLDVSSDEELNLFLGKLFKKAKQAVGRFAKSGAGRALGGILKSAAKRALPVVGGALGNVIAPGIGGAIGSKLASGAGSLFGLEIDDDEVQFETAKKFVKFATEAAKAAAKAPPSAPTKAVVKSAVKHGLRKVGVGAGSSKELGGSYYGYARPRTSSSRQGRWFRRGNKIVLVGA